LALIAKGPHGLRIHAVNAAAREAGVSVGDRLADVRAAFPALVVRRAQPARDGAALVDLAHWLGRYGPARNVHGEDGAWIDVTGVPHLFGGESGLCADLHRRLTNLGLTSRLGLADTLGAAHALARFAPSGGVTVAPPGETRRALASLPVAALRLAPAAQQLLVRLGLKRIAQLYGLPRAALAARFRDTQQGRGRGVADAAAANVVLRLDQAVGLVAEPLRPLTPAPDAQARLAFAEPLVTSDGLLGALDRLAADVTDGLARQDLGARRFRLTLYRTDGTVAEAGIGTSRPSRDPAHVCRLLGERVVALDAGFGIDVLVLDATGLEPLAARQTGLDTDGPGGGTPDPALLIDRLVNRLGPERVLRFSPRASHLPERAETWTAAIETPSPSASGPPPTAVAPATTVPLLLIEPPEPVGVIAEVPEGAPQRLVWRRVARRIVRSEGPERIAPEWWRHLGPGGRRPGTRDYYRLEDASGGRYWVFREGLYGDNEEHDGVDGGPRWFLHGLLA
jgi:protein ImuB